MTLDFTFWGTLTSIYDKHVLFQESPSDTLPYKNCGLK